jgi:crotonobetainyl-CoA:carnitine CoA-transferase CaiB-like acyl-CoA transferase
MLSNIKVVDLSRILAGPLCTMMLGDLGASVIKVELPGDGDETRKWGPPFDSRGESAYYLSVNRNKKSVAADLDQDADRNMVLGLIREADVVVENFRSGTLARRGIVASDLLQENSSLVWCTITGFGGASSRGGYDLVVQAESGWMSITGNPSGDPMRVGVALADIIAGKDAAIAILAALASRTDGEPLSAAKRRITVSLLHSATAALINVAQNTLVTGEDARRWGNQHPNLVPYQLFHAKDRPIIVAVGSDKQWQCCAKVLELDDLANDSALTTNAGRLANRSRIIDALSSRIARRAAVEWIELFDAVGVPCGIVNSVSEALSAVETSPLTGIAPIAGEVRLPPPMLDEHGEEIRTLGWRVFSRE